MGQDVGVSESGPVPGDAGGHRRSDRPSDLPPNGPVDQDDDQRSTTALPRPAEPPRFDSRYSSPAAQSTTALPRTPPAAGSHPWTPPSRGFVSGYRDSGTPDNGYRSASGTAGGRTGDAGAGHRGPGGGSGGYSGAGHTGAGYIAPGYSGASPSGAGDRGFQRLEPRSEQAPVGPSWAPQHPYPSESADPPAPDGEQRHDPYRRPAQAAEERYQPYARSDVEHQRRPGPQYDGGLDPADHRYSADRDARVNGGYERSDRAPHDYPADRDYDRRDREPRDHTREDRAPHDYPADRDYEHRDYEHRDYQSDRGYDDPAVRRPPPRGSHLPPYSEPLSAGSAAPGSPTASGMRSPRKLTVTRVAALRSRELTSRGVQMFHNATTADGADKSGLTSLTYAVMANYAVDAALAVALAGTLFFAAATAESTGRVLLYLVITVAPFAVIAPFIGPMLDRLQSGRRLALALSSFGRALLAVLMAFNFSHFNPWVIYPCALGNLVLSKAFGVLKAALTPRVLPEQITLVKTNSRLTTFGMIAGGAAGAVAAGLSKITGSPGALFFTAACAIAGGVLCLRIPAWVESTEGEVPVKEAGSGTRSKGFPQIVTATLWANSMIRVETGFLALFIAFVVKSQYPAPQHSAFTQLLLLGVVGGAAGVGGFVGNTMGARLTLSAPETISIFALVSVLVSTIIAVLVPGLATAAIVGFVGSTASALAKVSLDSVIQHHLPEESRASAFGVSESVLQLGWVFGGVVGLLLGGVWTFGHASVYAIGFGTITLMLVVGLVQSYLVRSGRTMVPKIHLQAGRRSRRRTARTARAKDAGRPGDTDRLTRPAPSATAHLPTVDPDPPRRRPRKAGGDR